MALCCAYVLGRKILNTNYFFTPHISLVTDHTVFLYSVSDTNPFLPADISTPAVYTILL